MWYYAENSEQRGPVTKEDLGAKLQSGELTRDTLVWTNNMRNWEKACEVEELAEFMMAVQADTGLAMKPAQDFQQEKANDAQQENIALSNRGIERNAQASQSARQENNASSTAESGTADDASPINLRPSGAGVGATYSGGTQATTAPQPAALTCQRCGKTVSPSVALNYQGTIICPDCKQQYLHDLYEQHGTSHVDYPAASIWARLGAFIVDSFILSIIGFIIGGCLGFIIGVAGGILEEGEMAIVLAQLVGYLVNICVFVFYETFFICMYGATPGKMLLGLKVLHYGEKLSVGRALGRALSKKLSGAICCMGFFIAVFTQDSKALHDMMCDTIVVSTK